MRQAQSRLPDGTIIERDWTPRELYMLYVRGFRDGASITAMRKDHDDLDPYLRGYGDGMNARIVACMAFAKELGHVPPVLRACEGDDR